MKCKVKKIQVWFGVCVIVFLAFGAGLIVAQTAAPAAPQFSASASLFSNLSLFKGKTVTVTLVSGQTVTGLVKDVTGAMLHLEKLSGKEFFDAIILIERITAVEARVR